MCWTTFESPERLIAEEDIPIFKVCVEASEITDHAAVYSYFKQYPYKLDKVYKLDRRLSLDLRLKARAVDIYYGYHSYLETECSFEKYPVFDQWAVMYKDSRYLCAYEHFAVKVSGYIPKGSEYYVNEQGECVSNSICLTKIFK